MDSFTSLFLEIKTQENMLENEITQERNHEQLVVCRSDYESEALFFWRDVKRCIQVEKKTHQEKILAVWAVSS